MTWNARTDEQRAVEQAARTHALSAFNAARTAYHGALKAKRRDYGPTVMGKLAADLDRTEDECIRLGLDPWKPASTMARALDSRGWPRR